MGHNFTHFCLDFDLPVSQVRPDLTKRDQFLSRRLLGMFHLIHKHVLHSQEKGVELEKQGNKVN